MKKKRWVVFLYMEIVHRNGAAWIYSQPNIAVIHVEYKSYLKQLLSNVLI